MRVQNKQPSKFVADYKNTEWEVEEERGFKRGEDDLSKINIYMQDENGYIMCQWCGKPLVPSKLTDDPKIALSSNKFTARKELTWQMHVGCVKKAHELIDKKVPGLMAERRHLYEDKNKEKPKPKEKPKTFAQLKMRK